MASAHTVNLLCDKHLQRDNLETLQYMHDYTKGGLLIMGSIKVSVGRLA